MNRKSNLNTLVLGLEHFIDKIGYQACEYMKNGVSVKYLVSDKSNTSAFYAKKYAADVEVLPQSKVLIFISCFFKMLKLKLEYVELYDTGNMFIVYILISFILRRKVIVIYRGGELQKHQRRKFSLNYMKHFIATKVASKIVVKEKNIIEEYKKNNFPLSKMYYLYNCVPLLPVTEFKENRTIDLLFLNSIRKNRNVPFLIDVIAKLYKEKPDINVVIAGFNSLDDESLSFELEEEQRILNTIKEKKLESVIKVHGFVKNPNEYHLNSKIFVFPADIVFANYSLLESMGCGCVPIVANGEGSNLIVTQEEGSIIELDIDKWAAMIIQYINSPSLLQKKSLQSRNKIEFKFSMQSWFKRMMALRQEE